MYLVYLKYWSLNHVPIMVYHEVLFHPNFSIKTPVMTPWQDSQEPLVLMFAPPS